MTSELKDTALVSSAIAKVNALYEELDAIRNSEIVNGEQIHSLGNIQQNLIGIKYSLENVGDLK